MVLAVKISTLLSKWKMNYLVSFSPLVALILFRSKDILHLAEKEFKGIQSG